MEASVSDHSNLMGQAVSILQLNMEASVFDFNKYDPSSFPFLPAVGSPGC